MALRFKNPIRSRLKVTGTVVKAQQREGVAFYVIPSVVVLAVLIFCYTVPPPASAHTADVAQNNIEEPKPSSTAILPPAVPKKAVSDEDAAEAELLAEDDEEILDAEEDVTEAEDEAWAEEDDEDWIDGSNAEEFVDDEDFEAVDGGEVASGEDDSAPEDEEAESPADQTEEVPVEPAQPSESGSTTQPDAPKETVPVKPQPKKEAETPSAGKPAATKAEKAAEDEEFKKKLEQLFN